MSWQAFIKEEARKSYFQSLKNRLKQRYQISAVYPPQPQVMNAFKFTSFQDTKVVILGQDPYHGVNQAHGLSFSVPESEKIPPSLMNIFREVNRSTKSKLTRSGNLERWAKQGVLLLNSILTVQAGQPSSHSDLGWEQFTDNAIKKISNEREGVVFMLWGNYAKGKSDIIDEDKHMILESTHPSPFSAHKGFVGCDHFNLANSYLNMVYGSEIDWR